MASDLRARSGSGGVVVAGEGGQPPQVHDTNAATVTNEVATVRRRAVANRPTANAVPRASTGTNGSE